MPAPQRLEPHVCCTCTSGDDLDHGKAPRHGGTQSLYRWGRGDLHGHEGVLVCLQTRSSPALLTLGHGEGRSEKNRGPDLTAPGSLSCARLGPATQGIIHRKCDRPRMPSIRKVECWSKGACAGGKGVTTLRLVSLMEILQILQCANDWRWQGSRTTLCPGSSLPFFFGAEKRG